MDTQRSGWILALDPHRPDLTKKDVLDGQRPEFVGVYARRTSPRGEAESFISSIGS
jgi:hypothetical protein